MACQKVCKQGRDDIIGARCACPTLASWLEDSRYVCTILHDSVYLHDLFKQCPGYEIMLAPTMHCIPLVVKVNLQSLIPTLFSH